MKALTMRTLIALALAGTMSNVAWAGDEGLGKQCDSKTLRGSYVFTASGFNITGGVAQPKAIVELIEFHGDGTLSVTGGVASINGVIMPIGTTGVGNYTLGPDCNGTLNFVPGPSFSLFVDADGKNGWMIQTNGNTVFQGTVTRRK